MEPQTPKINAPHSPHSKVGHPPCVRLTLLTCALDHIQPYLQIHINQTVAAGLRTIPVSSGRKYLSMKLFKDAGHLLRFAFLFVVAFAVFLTIRHFVVPKSFGQYGHYRGASIGEIAARPVHFAGHETCETCHADILEMKNTGDPSILPAKLDTADLCIQCHATSAAKPKGFPQVDADQHSGGLACETCHKPHKPALASGGAK